MRQHILRLLIVLVLVLGIGFIVCFFVRDNNPFLPTNYITKNIKQDENLNANCSTLSSKVNSRFEEDIVIYNIYNSTSEYYAALLINTKLNKSEEKEIKNLYKNYRNKVNNLIFSTKSLIEYLALEDKNITELNGRKEKVNTDFNDLNKAYYLVVSHLENLVEYKIYSENNTSVLGSLKSALIELTNVYNENRNNFSFINDVNNKINDFIANDCYANEDAVKFVIKYNSLEKQEIKDGLKNYFLNNVTSDDIKMIVNFLSVEVYYEEN